MGTFRTSAPVRRSLGLAIVLASAIVVASCGSSSSSTSTSTTLQATSVPSVVPSSVPPSPSTLPATSQAPCSALASALAISDLRPKNAGNWTAEKQRIITDTASNVALLAAASNGAPPDVATALDTLKGYSTWLGTVVANASTFDAAMSAVNNYPDMAGASLATSVVESWQRKNC